MKSVPQKATRFRFGDRVQFPMVHGKMKGVIVEDRGPHGVDGQHLFQISVPMDPFEPEMYFIKEGELEPAPESNDRAELTKERILAYLKNAGLTRMLRVDSPGRQFQPRAWLCVNQLGDITHTFAPERGLLGGGTVPYGALCFDRIRKSKVGEVVEFLEHFGLSKKEAEQLIREIGTTR
jgi:hypothetical protein